jgi:hypothetical protein
MSQANNDQNSAQTLMETEDHEMAESLSPAMDKVFGFEAFEILRAKG